MRLRHRIATAGLDLKLAAPLAADADWPVEGWGGRFTENEGSATLPRKTPSHVYAPYLDEAGEELRTDADELDGVFTAIADRVEAAAAQ